MKTNLLLLTVASLTLLSCGHNDDISSRQIELARIVSSALMHGEEKALSSGYECVFTADYQASWTMEVENISRRYGISHFAHGSLSKLYEKSVSTPSGKRYSDGRGYIEGNQVERVKLSEALLLKNENNGTHGSDIDYEYDQSFGLCYDDAYLFAYSQSVLNNHLANPSNTALSFRGKTKKNAKDGYSDAVLDTMVSRMLFLSAWDEVFRIISASSAYFASMDLGQDEAMKEFIRTHSFEASESDKFIVASFRFDVASLHDNTALQGMIPVKVNVDKSSGVLETFSFDYKDVFASTLNRDKANKSSFFASVKEFGVEWHNLHTRFDTVKLKGEFKEFPAQDFAQDLLDSAFPRIEGVEVTY